LAIPYISIPEPIMHALSPCFSSKESKFGFLPAHLVKRKLAGCLPYIYPTEEKIANE